MLQSAVRALGGFCVGWRLAVDDTIAGLRRVHRQMHPEGYIVSRLNSHEILATVQAIIDWRRAYQGSYPTRRCVFVSTTTSPCSGSATT